MSHLTINVSYIVLLDILFIIHNFESTNVFYMVCIFIIFCNINIINTSKGSHLILYLKHNNNLKKHELKRQK